MKKLLLAIALCTSFISFSQETNQDLLNELIIKFKETEKPDSKKSIENQKFDKTALDNLNLEHNLKSFKLTGNKKLADTYLLKFNSDKDVKTLIEVYKGTELFEYVEPNFKTQGHGVRQTTPNDAFFSSRQWSHSNDGTFTLSPATVDADIDTDLAWDITQGDSNTIVAILDTGLRLRHPEFDGRIWQNTAETLDGSDSDGNNYIDDTEAGWDFANDDNLPVDDNGHGTNVAGIAIATGNNNIGYAGMNWNSQIMVCKVLDDANSGFYSWMTEAIYYAVDNGANVINLSVGGNSSSATLEAAVDYAFANNVALVVSTGNQDSSIQYPARYTNAIAVGSTNSDDTRTSPFFWSTTSGSNFGPEIDFTAPGNYMYGLSFSSDTNYGTYWGGTSQAAPHVAGLISLLLAVEPNLTVTQIRDILIASSEDQVGDADDTPGWDQYYGHGRINAYNALLSTTLSSSQFNISNEEISLYPNPVSKGLNVTLSNVPNGDYETIIYDISGKTLFNTSLTSNSEKVAFDVPNLSNGFYFIKLTNTKNKQFIHKKIFIK